MYFSNRNFMYRLTKEYQISMEYWQIIFLNIAIIGFISQLLIYILFFKTISGSKRLNDKELLEKIYNKPTSHEIYNRNLNFKSHERS